MKLRGMSDCIIVAAMLSTLLVCQAQAQEIKQVQPGLEIITISTKNAARAHIFVARASLQQFRVNVASPSGSEPGDTITNFLGHLNAAAVVSGGFLTSFYPPIALGLLKTAGKLQNRQSGGDLLNGVIAVKDRRVAILPIANFSDPAWDDALQSGPLLVVDGRSALKDRKPPRGSTRDLIEQPSVRAFVALVGDAQILLGWTQSMTLPELTDILIRSTKDGGLQATTALNLGGAATAGLIVRGPSGDTVQGNAYSTLANALAISRVVEQRPLPSRRGVTKR